MYTSGHTMKTLFQQLGLNYSDEAIDEFINTHKLSEDKLLDQAEFWNPSQAEFIRESWQQDADWTGIIDQLDAQLRD